MKFCVIGIGHFGYQVATTLAEHGVEVLAVDQDESLIASIRDKVNQAVCMDVSSEESLRSLSVEEMDAVVVAMGENFAQSILITALLRQHFTIPRIIARAVSLIHRDILLLIGADEVVMPEQEMGTRVADRLSLPFHALTRLTPDISLSYRRAPQDAVGKPVEHLFTEHGVVCLGKKIKESIELVGPSYRVQAQDMLVYAGANRDLEKLARL